jgi:hypothetical protein
VVVIVAAVLVTWAILSNSWYVARSGNTVALFHGLQSAPLGVRLSSVEQRGIPFNELTPVDQAKVHDGIVAESHADGVCILARLKFAAEDAAHTKAVRTAASKAAASATHTPRVSPSAGASATKSPKASPSAQATATPSVTPTPKATPSPIPTATPLPKSCAS